METLEISKGQRVGKFSSVNQFYTGTVKKVSGHKALVYFETRGFSRWCSKSNLEVLTKKQPAQKEVYIENYKSGKTYDPIENRWYGASWEVETMTREEAEGLIANNPDEFENCQIVEK